MLRHTLIQAAGYLALAALVYEWLGIGERSLGQVMLSAVVGAAIVFAAVWLFGNALAPRFALRNWPRFVAWVVAAAAAIAACMWLGSYRANAGLGIASRLTLWFRRPVKPATMGSIYAGAIWIVGVAAFLALLPFASAAAEGVGRGAREALRAWKYWVGCAVMIAAGCWLPGLLLGWVPKAAGFGAQTASLVARFSLAYAIALAAWLEVAWLARRYRSAAGA